MTTYLKTLLYGSTMPLPKTTNPGEKARLCPRERFISAFNS